MDQKITMRKVISSWGSIAIGLSLLISLIWLLPGTTEAGGNSNLTLAKNYQGQRGPHSAEEIERAYTSSTLLRNPLPVEPHVRIQKNDDYYDAASVAITQATSLFIDQDEAWERYKLGEFDAIPLSGSAWEEVTSGSTYTPQLSVYPNGCLNYYGFSTDVPPFDDELVRAAFASSIDREQLIEEQVGGAGIPALTLTPPGEFGHVDGFTAKVGHEYSPTLAMAYLTASPYYGALPEITLMVNESSINESVAKSIKQMWYDTLGVSVTIETVPYPEMRDLLATGEPEDRPGIFRMGWCADYPDANNWHKDAILNANLTRYENSTYQDFIGIALGEQDPSSRADLYEQAERYLVMTDTAIVPIYYGANVDLTRPDVDRTYRPFGAQHLDEWSITTRGPERPLEMVSYTPSGIDPAGIDWQGANQQIVEQLFLGLTDITEDGDVTGELATSWSISDDGLVYTFTLRSDAEWTDGSPVTAGDVEYGVLRSLDPSTNSGYAYLLYAIKNAADYNNGNISDPGLVGVDALNDTTIRFELENPAVYFPTILALPPAYPQPEWAIDAYGNEWTDPANIETNGPYKLVSLVLPPHLRIEKDTKDTPGEGGNMVFYIHYFNDGASEAENVVITDTLVAGMTYLSDTSGLGVTLDGNKVIWDLGTVNAHTDGEFELFVHITGVESDIITNTAQIATTNPIDEGDSGEKYAEWSGTIEENNTHLNVSKWAWLGNPAPDTEILFFLDICNGYPWGSTGSSEALITDTLQGPISILYWWSDTAGLNEVSSSDHQLVLSTPSIPAYYCGKIYVKARVDPDAEIDSSIINHAVVNSSNNLETNNDSTWEGKIGEPYSNLAIYKYPFIWYGTMLVPGGQYDYGLNYHNEGNTPIFGPIYITDTFPASMTFMSSAHHTDFSVDAIEPIELTDTYGVWELDGLESGESGTIVVSMRIGDDAAPGTVLENSAEISTFPEDQDFSNNADKLIEIVADHGPNLRVTKNHEWYGIDKLHYSFSFRNIGDETVYNIAITDTLPANSTFTGNHNVWGWGDIGFTDNYTDGQLIWHVDQMDPGWSAEGWYEITLDDPGPLRWFTNKMEITEPEGETYPDDNVYEDVAFSGGEVRWAEIGVYGYHVWGQTNVGPITVTTPYGGYIWPDCCDFDWESPEQFQPGDIVTIEAGKGKQPVTFTIPDPFDALADSDTDQVWGQIDHLDHGMIDIEPDWEPAVYAETDSDGNFNYAFSDIPRGGSGVIRYTTEQDYAQITYRRNFRTEDLSLRVNYGHDWVGGDYQAGHTVWITVTESDGITPKATGVAYSNPDDGWGQDGFATNESSWDGDIPDIQPGDWVYGLVDTGKSNAIQIGEITGNVDSGSDSIWGTVDAGWIGEEVNITCHPWGSPGGAPTKDDRIMPNDSDVYSCSWDPGSEWDVDYNQDIAVQYSESDNDSVINVFQDGIPDLVVSKWNSNGYFRPGGVYAYPIYYNNQGSLTAFNTIIVDTLPAGLSYVDDTSGLAMDISGSGVITWYVGDLEPNNQNIFWITVQVPGDTTPGSQVIDENCASINSDSPELDMSNNEACSGRVDVWDDEVEIGVNKWASPNDPTPGQEFQYTIQWCNNRGAAAGPVWLTDTLPANTSLVSWQHQDWWQTYWKTIKADDEQVVFYAPSLPGDTCQEIYLRLRLDDGTTIGDELENTVVINTADDVYLDNNTATSSVTISAPRQDLEIQKNVHVSVPVPGGWVNYFLHYWNNGNTETHAWITETVPSGLTFEGANWGGGTPYENQSLPAPTVIGDQLVWDMGVLPVGSDLWFHVQMNISDAHSEGDTIDNCAYIGSDGIDDNPANNTGCTSFTLNPNGPNLYVTKSHQWNGSGQLQYRIYYTNMGDETIYDVWVTDTLPISTHFNGWWQSDWMNPDEFTNTGDTASWKFNQLDPGNSGWLYFQANLDNPGERLRWYTNTVEIATPPGDINAGDNIYTDVAFSGGEVDRVEMWFNPDHENTNIYGNAEPGSLVTVTTPYDQFYTWADPDCGGCWNIGSIGLVNPGDAITVIAGSGLLPVVINVPDPYNVQVDTSTGLVYGQIGGWNYQTVEVYGEWENGYQEVNTDGDGNFAAAYPDIPPSAGGYVRYATTIDYAEIVFHKHFWSLDFALKVNYGDDWVEGDYEPGHTLWITVTESDRTTIKGTAELQTGYVPWWNGNSGFATNWQGWIGDQPDIQPGDWVFGKMDNGYSAEAQIGQVDGFLNPDIENVSGVVTANWIGHEVDIECYPWGDAGYAPAKSDRIWPDGSDVYSCSWDPGTEWDVIAGQELGVFYIDDNYNRIGSSFRAPQIQVAIGPNSGGNRHVWGMGAFVNDWVTVTVRAESGAFIASTTTQADSWGNFDTGDSLPVNSVAFTPGGSPFWNNIEVDFTNGYTTSMTIQPMGIEANPDTDVITVTVGGPPFFSVNLDYYNDGEPGNRADLGNIGDDCTIVVNMMAEYGFDVRPGTFLDAHVSVWGEHVMNYNFVVPFLNFRINSSHQWIEGKATPNNTIVATIWRDGLPAMAYQTDNGGGTDWNIQLDNDEYHRFMIGDKVEITTSDGQSAIVEIIPMTGEVDSAANTISGRLEGVPFPADIRGEVWQIDGAPAVEGTTDGDGNYTIDFSPFDLDPGNMIALWYIQPDGNQLGIIRHGLQLRVDTSDDDVHGETAANVPVTVTINGGETQTTMSNAAGNFELTFSSDIIVGDLVEGWSGWNTEYASLVVVPVTASIDEANDKAWGYGPANRYFNVAVNNDWQWVSSDDTGYFEAQYGWDVTSDNDLVVEYYYPEDHRTEYRYGRSDLEINKWTRFNNMVPGETFTYTIEYSNKSNGDVDNVIITDTLPPWISYLSDTSGVIPTWDASNRTLEWTIGHLASYRNVNFEVQVLLDINAPMYQQLTNVIEIYDPEDWNPSNNWNQTDIYPNDELIDLWVNKLVESGQPIPGGVITYQINYGNNGNQLATNVLLTDTLPASVSYVGTTFDGSYTVNAGQVVFELGEVRPGDSGIIELSVQIDIHEDAGNLLANETQIACDQDEINPRDNWHRLTTVVEPEVADVWVEKDIWGDLSDINNSFIYHISFGNQGLTAAEDVVITDTLPVSITQIWHSAGSAVTISDGVIVWNIGTIPPGSSGELMIGVQVDTPVPVGTVLTNTVDISTSTPELDYENNQALAVLGPPKVITVPWAGDRPHRVWSGLDTTLKGTAKGFGLTGYEWDPGDGSPVITGWVNDPYIIEADHTYIGNPGDTFTATLKVGGAFGWADTDTYVVKIYSQTQGIKVDVAVDEGLWYLHKSTNRYYYGGHSFAEWANSGNRVAEDASAIQAFQVHGHRPGGDPMEDPYVEDVQQGWNGLFSYAVLDAMTVEPAGDPDTSGDGVGVGLYSDYNHSIYESGIALMALATTGTPDQVANTGPAVYVRGQTYLSIAQNMSDWFAWGQNDYDWARGGWRYQPNSGDSDNSNTQFPVLGLAAAEDTWGVTIPSWVKDELRDYWLASTQNADGGFGYNSNNDMVNVAKTGAGIIDLVWSGVSLDDTRVISASTYIETHWNDPKDDTNFGGNVGDLYAMYAVKKGSQLAEILAYGPYDWQSIYDAQVTGMQNPDGSIDEDSNLGIYFNNWQPIATAWSLLILAPGIYEADPVPIIAPIHFGGLGPDWNNGEIQFDGSLSHHTDPDRIITYYEWDFGDASPVISTTIPTVVHAYAARGIYLASLTVWDDAGRSATRPTRVNITAPDTPPVADPNGPYLTDPGQGVWLDATGSYDPDAWLGDTIVEYDWDLGDGNTVSTTIPALFYTYTNPGLYQVILTVRDLGADFGLDSPQWSDPAATSVGVDYAIAGLSAINDSPTVLGETTTLEAAVTAGTSVVYTWDLGDGTADAGNTVNHVYPHVGVFTATVTARNNVNQSSTETVVTVIDEEITGLTAINDGPTPLGKKTTLSALITTGTNVVYEWDLGDGTKGSGAVIQHKYTSVGSFIAVVTATNSLNHQSNTTTVVIEPVADLSILKTDKPDPVIVGQPLTYTLFVVNGGPSAATGVILTDTLPVGVTYVSNDSGCTVTGRIVVCHLADLAAPPPNASTTIHIVVTPTAAGTLMNFAEVGSNMHDLVKSNNLSIQYTTVVVAPVYNPVVNSIAPDSGHNDVVTPVTIQGGNFQSGATAMLGSTALSSVTFINGNTLTANVPAGMTPGTYKLTVTNPDSRSGVLLDAFTVLAPTPPVPLDVAPTQGPNDVPVTIDVYGQNFANGLVMTLTLASRRSIDGPDNGGVPVESLLFIDNTHVRGVVPVDIAPGMYDLSVANPDGRDGLLADAYEVYEAAVYDDLYASTGDLWLNPPSYRQGDAVTPKVGLRLRRQGGDGNLTNVQVDFYKGNPASGGTLIGTGTVATLAPDSVAVTSVDWLPKPNAGTYTLYAVIDPANAVAEEVEGNNTISLGVVVLPPRADVTPPVVASLTINEGAAATSVRQVTFDLAATDLGGSGVKDVQYISFQFIQSVGDWVPIAYSGWIPYETSSVSFPWMLQPEPGIRYIQAWVSDKAGNISATPGQQYINYVPAVAHVAQSQVHIFRYTMAVGERMRVRLTSVTGDADLYIWDPSGGLVAFSGVDNPEDVTFTAAAAGTYQIEVEGYTAADYSLEVIPLGSSREPDTIFRGAIQQRGWPYIAPENTPTENVGMPSAPVGESAIYLPLVIRQ